MTTLADLIDEVNDNLPNHAEMGSATQECDGLITRIHLPDHFLDDDGTLQVILDTTLLTELVDYEMNYANSWCYLFADPPPDAPSVYTLTYRYRHWPLSLVRAKLNAGLRYLHPKFYAVEELVFDGNSTTKTFALAPTNGEVTGILDVFDGDYRLTPMRDYRVNRGALESATLSCFTAPQSSVRVMVAKRIDSFPSDSSTLAELGIPERAKDPLVYYACWQLLNQKMAPRVRTDTVTPMATEGMATFNDQFRTSQYWKVLLDTEMTSKRMRSWTKRGL